MAHTPAPWYIYEDESPIIMATIGDEKYDIAELPDEYLDQEQIQANARLIRRAPDLLKALVNLLEDVEYAQSQIKPGLIGKIQVRKARELVDELTNGG